MSQAFDLALEAKNQNEVPVGAILVKGDKVVGRGYNRSIALQDPTAHAEIQAIRDAGQRLNNYRLVDTTLYVTLEPCVMCAGAIIQARIARVVFAAPDPKSGAAGSVFNLLQNSQLNHRAQVEQGVMQEECSHLLSTFFREKRCKTAC